MINQVFLNFRSHYKLILYYFLSEINGPNEIQFKKATKSKDERKYESKRMLDNSSSSSSSMKNYKCKK